MCKRIEYRLVGMTCYQHSIFLCGTPIIHIDIMQRFQIVIGRRVVCIYFKEFLQRTPAITYKPFTESIAIALFVSLMAVSAKNIQEFSRRKIYADQYAGIYPDRLTVNFF